MGLHNLSEVGTRRTCLTRLDGENCTFALNFGIQDYEYPWAVYITNDQIGETELTHAVAY
jgi:hypothetical protein